MLCHLDDKKLVDQMRAGDSAAFARFFDENFPRLYRFAVARLGNDNEAARDVVQITLTKAVRSLSQYRAESALFTWLCAICRNEASDWLAKRGRQQTFEVPIEDHPDVRAIIDSLQAPSDAGPEYQYRREYALRMIQAALDQLPVHYGNVLEWKYVEGYSVREIAERLGIGTEAAQSLIARAKRAFAEVYGAMVSAMDCAPDGLAIR